MLRDVQGMRHRVYESKTAHLDQITPRGGLMCGQRRKPDGDKWKWLEISLTDKRLCVKCKAKHLRLNPQT